MRAREMLHATKERNDGHVADAAAFPGAISRHLSLPLSLELAGLAKPTIAQQPKPCDSEV